MPDFSNTSKPRGLNGAYLIAVCLEVGAAVYAVVTLGVAIWSLRAALMLVPAVPGDKATVDFALLVLGAWPALVMLAAAAILRRMERLLVGQETSSGSPILNINPTPRPGLDSGASVAALNELVGLTREVRDLALLNEQERSQRMRTMAGEHVQRLEEEVPALLRDHNWVEARRRVQTARERFPSLPNWDPLERRIEEVRAGVESQDVEATGRVIADLVNLGAWDRVADALRDLTQRHPDSARAAELVRKITLDRQRAEAEQRARIMAAAQDATNRRDWNEALSHVNTMLRRYPESPEAAELQSQLATVTANAEIQTRQRMEAEIRDLIKEHRYADALEVATDLINRYPTSPQAGILRDQLPRLQQRAAEAGRV